MSVRRMRQLLWTLAAVLALTGLGILAWAWQTTTDLAVTVRTESSVDHHASSTPGLMPTLELAAIRPLWSRQYQRPLYDPPPPPPREETVRRPPPLRLKLLGTVIEPDNTQAILMKGDGSIAFKRVGEQVDEATIEMIDNMQIVVRYHDEPHTLQVQSD